MLSKTVMVALLAAMLGSTLAGVFFRYFLNDALSWSEEAARFAMIWVAVLGGGLTYRAGGHIAVDMFLRKLPKRFAWVGAGIVASASAAFIITFTWYGAKMVENVWMQRSAALEMSMAVPYAALPVGGVFMLYHLVASLIEARVNRTESPIITSELNRI